MNPDSRQDKSRNELSILEEIDAICDRFEAEWRKWESGPRPRIETFVGRARTSAKARLLDELLRVEIANRRRLGENPTPTDYQQRFSIGPAKLANLLASP